MVRVVSRTAPTGRLLLLLAATGIAYYAAAYGALALTQGGHGIATLWPAAGILLAVLVLVPARHAAAFIAVAAIASVVANLQSGLDVANAFGFAAADMIESALAAWLLRTRARCRLSFTQPAGLGCFCKAVLLASAVSATVALAAAPVRSVAFWLSWFSTDLLGALIVTPLIVIVCRSFQGSRIRPAPRQLLEIAALLALVGLVSGLAFWQTRYPLLFLPMLAVILAVVRLGPFGAAGGVLIVALVSSVCVALGRGPDGLAALDLLTRSLFLQFYLLALFLGALPIASLLAARTQLLDKLSNRMRLLQMAESAAQVGHWRVEIATGTIFWSQEVFRIHGLPDDVPPTLDQALGAYHPDDRARVSDQIGRSIDRREPFDFLARIVRPDGEVRHVRSRGEIDGHSGDDDFGLFGIIQDITAQVAQERSLDEARLRAEEAARIATMAAETDALTGIANRRRILDQLDRSILSATRDGYPLSVAIFDIDHFKQINDRFGHQVGDTVIRRVALTAQGLVRATDSIGRFGGEEFVIVLPDASAQTALLVAERVRAAIEGEPADPAVTISIGIARLRDGDTVETVLKRADDALYAAKREGRNTLRLAA